MLPLSTKMFCSTIILFAITATLLADRYSWVQPWNKPIFDRLPGREAALQLQPIDWIQGRLNLGYEYHLPGSSSLFIRLLLQHSNLSPAAIFSLMANPASMMAAVELGASHVLQISQWAEGLRGEIALNLAYLQQLKGPGWPFFGSTLRIGFQGNSDALLIYPYFQARLLFTVGNIADAILQRSFLPIILLPRLPLVNQLITFTPLEKLPGILSFSLGLRFAFAFVNR